MQEIESLITKLALAPHPEGGYFRETYRSAGITSVENLGFRNYSTCIYFLVTPEAFSAFHRIRQDEIWHFYLGKPLKLYLISPDGKFSTRLIGNEIKDDHLPQFVIPAGYWFAAHVESDYALVGCTVSPGFDFRDFEMAKRAELIRKFPELAGIITRFTR